MAGENGNAPATKQDIERLMQLFERVRLETKDDIERVRLETKDTIERVRLETKGDIERLRLEARDDIERVRQAVQDERDRVVETMRDIETHMLTEFHRYARGQTARLHSLESSDNDIKIRLAALEERVLELESRIRPKH